MSSKLFAFSRPLPAPFDKAKKKVKVSSKYGDGTEATLCSTVVKAVQAYFKCKDGSAPGAVGLCGTKGVAEYKSASGPEVYHLAVYDPAGGAMLASIYNKDTEMLETYAVRNNGQDGAAIMMSMLPALMADDEFRENLDALEVQYQGGYPDMGEATERMAILCDNAYRRINDSSCAAHLPTSIDGTGNVMRVSTTHIDSGNFRPDTVVAGMFTILANSTDTNIIARSSRERQLALTEELKALLAQTPYPDKDVLAALDDRFIAENLSPGGSADLLALTWLLHFVTTEGNIDE